MNGINIRKYELEKIKNFSHNEIEVIKQFERDIKIYPSILSEILNICSGLLNEFLTSAQEAKNSELISSVRIMIEDKSVWKKMKFYQLFRACKSHFGNPQSEFIFNRCIAWDEFLHNLIDSYKSNLKYQKDEDVKGYMQALIETKIRSEETKRCEGLLNEMV